MVSFLSLKIKQVKTRDEKGTKIKPSIIIYRKLLAKCLEVVVEIFAHDLGNCTKTLEIRFNGSFLLL